MSEVLLPLFYFLLFLYFIGKFSFFECEGLTRKQVSFLFVLKLLFGIVFYLVYTRIYTDRSTSDAFKYFNDAKIIFSALPENPSHFFRIVFGINTAAPDLNIYFSKLSYWDYPQNLGFYNDGATITRFNALLMIISGSNYFVHIVFINFVSFLGLIAIYKSFTFLTNKPKIVAGIFVIPSVLFWGSGLLKEGLLLFSLGFFLYHFLHYLKHKTWNHLFLSLIFGYLLFISKYYVIFALLPGLFVLFLNSIAPVHNPWKRFVWVHVILIILFVLANTFTERDFVSRISEKRNLFLNSSREGYYFESKDGRKLSLFVLPSDLDKFTSIGDSIYVINSIAEVEVINNGFVEKTVTLSPADSLLFEMLSYSPKPGSLIAMDPIEGTYWSVLKNLPSAFVNSFFRPHLFEIRSKLDFISALENTLFLVLLFMSYFFYRKPDELNVQYILFFASFVLFLFLLVGLVTPVLGALVRYKMPGLPFLYLLFIHLIDIDKLVERFPFLKKIL